MWSICGTDMEQKSGTYVKHMKLVMLEDQTASANTVS